MSDVPVPLLAKEFFTPEFLRDPYPTYRRYLDGPGLQYIDMARKRTDSGMPPRPALFMKVDREGIFWSFF